MPGNPLTVPSSDGDAPSSDGGRFPVIEREFAVRPAEARLEQQAPGRFVVSGAEKHALAWIVFHDSAQGSVAESSPEA